MGIKNFFIVPVPYFKGAPWILRQWPPMLTELHFSCCNIKYYLIWLPKVPMFFRYVPTKCFIWALWYSRDWCTLFIFIKTLLKNGFISGFKVGSSAPMDRRALLGQQTHLRDCETTAIQSWQNIWVQFAT